MRLIVLNVLIILITGCSAVGTIYTSDPSKKIELAYQLKKQGRPIKAQKLLNEAESIFVRENNFAGLADVNMAFGDLYKSDSYQNMSKVFKRWKEYKSYIDAATYFSKSAKLYAGIKNSLYAGFAKTGEGDAYYLASNYSLACAAYLEAEKFNSQLNEVSELLESRIRLFRKNTFCKS